MRRVLAAALALAAAACAGPSPAPESARIDVAPGEQAIVGVTAVSFQANAPSVKEPQYRWDFGDGTGAVGPTAEHVYRQEGAFTVALAVESGGGTLTARARVEVRSLSGSWHSRDTSGPIGGGFGFVLTQRGGVLTGRVPGFSSCPNPPTEGTIEGAAEHPLNVRWTLVCGSPTRWAGAVSPSLDTITVLKEGATEPRVYYRVGSPDEPKDRPPQ